MKIAVLILAFKNPRQLQKLVDALKTDFEVYIHFDKTSDIADMFEEEQHVHIIKNRYATYWGSSNTLLAALELFKAANKDGSDYNILISGQDLPIKSNEQIRSFITNNYKDYLYHFSLPASRWGHGGGMHRINLYWETKRNPKTLPGKIMQFAIRSTFVLIRTLQKTFSLKRKVGFNTYGGSFSLNFTKEATQYILNFVGSNKDFLSRFSHTRCADEIFFHTILLGFDYPGKDAIVNADIRFQDWETGPAYPLVFTISDLDRCLKAEEIFARKFDETVDAEVIDKILSSVAKG